MQPIAVISSPVGGLVYINGRLAGETGPGAPLILPVTPNGTVYAELRPFGRRWRAGAHRFRFVSGTPDNISDDACHIILWPGGICEIALSPVPAYPPESEHSLIDGIPVSVLRGEASILRAGAGSIALPDGAALPETHLTTDDHEIFLGSAPSKRYIAVFTRRLSPLGAITATEISRSGDMEFTAVTNLNDTAGHVRREIMTLAPSGLEVTSSVISASHRPGTPGDTALAAAEALLLGETDEAGTYLSPAALRNLSQLIAGHSGAIPAKYAPPDPQPAIALLRKLSDRVAAATPAYYSAVPSGSGWLIRDITVR